MQVKREATTYARTRQLVAIVGATTLRQEDSTGAQGLRLFAATNRVVTRSDSSGTAQRLRRTQRREDQKAGFSVEEGPVVALDLQS